MQQFKEGQEIKIKKEFCENSEELELVYIVKSVNSKTKRVYAEVQGLNFFIKPQELFSFDMVELNKKAV